MTTQQIADRLAAICKTGDFKKAQEELYGDDVVSIEPEASHGYEKETKGKKNVFAKIDQFMSTVEELHGCEVSDPLVTGNSFAFILTMDITMKGQDRMKMGELCVYEVKDGKVVLEQFFM